MKTINIALFFNNIRGLEVLKFLKHKKNTYVGYKKSIIQIISSSEKLVDREILH